eukprot:TRINITY_DN680_c1_g1_i1.p1 TRINITY_DN680_c1_g1~~TRINITY_DN680_c1_g1_i1.p1  ORF type:complete len:409 (-),score=50.07 TRINITY_DN680_c1_g1_i1:185-1411(-)
MMNPPLDTYQLMAKEDERFLRKQQRARDDEAGAWRESPMTTVLTRRESMPSLCTNALHISLPLTARFAGRGEDEESGQLSPSYDSCGGLGGDLLLSGSEIEDEMILGGEEMTSEEAARWELLLPYTTRTRSRSSSSYSDNTAPFAPSSQGHNTAGLQLVGPKSRARSRSNTATTTFVAVTHQNKPQEQSCRQATTPPAITWPRSESKTSLQPEPEEPTIPVSREGTTDIERKRKAEQAVSSEELGEDKDDKEQERKKKVHASLRTDQNPVETEHLDKADQIEQESSLESAALVAGVEQPTRPPIVRRKEQKHGVLANQRRNTMPEQQAVRSSMNNSKHRKEGPSGGMLGRGAKTHTTTNQLLTHSSGHGPTTFVSSSRSRISTSHVRPSENTPLMPPSPTSPCLCTLF